MCQYQPRRSEWPTPDHLATRIAVNSRERLELVCNGAGLFCDERLAARPGGGKRDVTGESPAGPGE